MQILQSKLQVPTNTEYLIQRIRLLEKIDFHFPCNLYLLKAPAGFGKTTFASQIYNQLPTNHSKTWVTVDENDQDSKRLICYITEGLLQTSKELKKFINTENTDTNNTSITEKIDNLCYIFQEHIQNQHWLFLDNWESANNKENGKIINQLILHTNQKLKIIITSRVNPSFNITRLVEKNIIQLLNQNELAFSFTEFMESLAKRKLHFTKEELEQLWDISKGWCINTAFIDESTKEKIGQLPNLSKTNFNFKLSENYILEEFFNNLEQDFLANLIISSLAKVVSSEVLTILLSSEDEVNNFIIKLKNSPIPFNEYSTDNYKYHPIFHHALSELARKKLKKEQIYTINNKLITYYLSKNLYLEALEKTAILNDEEYFLKFIDRHWLKLVEQGGLKKIHHLLSKISSAQREHPLYIKLYSNVLSQIGDNSSLIEFLADRIDSSLFKKNDTLLSSLWVKYYWSILHSTDKPSYKKVKASWEKIEKTKGPYKNKDKIGVETTLSCAAYMELNFDKAKQHIKKSIKYIGDSSFVYKINQLDNLAIFEFYTGNDNKALQIYYDNQKECKKRNIYHGMSNRLLYIAWVLISTGQLRKGLQTIDEAEQIMFQYESFDVKAKMFAERYRGIALFYLGYYKLAIQKLKDSLQYAEKYNTEDIIYTKIYIDYFQLLSGNKTTLTSEEDIKSINELSQTNLLLLTYKSYQGFLNKKKTICLKNAKKLLAISTKSKLLSWQALAYFLMALHAELAHNISSSSGYFLKGLSILQKKKWYSYPMFNNILTERIIIHAVKNNKLSAVKNILKSDYMFSFSSKIKNILKKIKYDENNYIQLFKLASNHEITGLESLAEPYSHSNSKQDILTKSAIKYLNTIANLPLSPLKIYMFDSFHVLADSRQISFTRKKSKQLLQILALHYPNSVNEEELIELLWPNSELSKGKSSLRTAIKDLRKDIDPNYQNRKDTYIIFEQSQYKLKLPEHSLIDITEFKQISEKILNTAANMSNEDSIESCYRCVQLYKNRLLTDDLNTAYSIEKREYYHLLYQKLILRFSELLVNENRNSDSAALVEKALTYDPLWREGVERLIKIYVLMNKSIKAYKTFDSYKHTLENELGIKPDSKLIDLVNAVI